MSTHTSTDRLVASEPMDSTQPHRLNGRPQVASNGTDRGRYFSRPGRLALVRGSRAGRLWLLVAMFLCLTALLAASEPSSPGQPAGNAAASREAGSTAQMKAHPDAIIANSSLPVLLFNPATVPTAASSAQTLTATFSVSGFSGSFIPTAAMHYGSDYTLSTVSCAGGGGSETCSVTVTFQPTLPGGRKDAVFLMNGTTRIGTLLVYGIGQGPLSAVEPGVVTSATPLPSSHYYYGSTIDENGIIYATTNTYDTVYRIAKDGTVTTLDVVGARGIDTIAIDGAGVLYLGCFSSQICTYDTVLGTVGAVPVPWTKYANDFQETITVDGMGNLFSIESAPNNGIVEELKNDGTFTSTTLNPQLVQPAQVTTDANGDVFVGGYSINELTTGGVQTQLNTVGATEGLAVDASGTLYATRNTSTYGVAELVPGNYSTPAGFLDSTDTIGSPLGLGLASNGTLGVGVYTNFDTVDRSQGALNFQNTAVGATTTQTADIRNIGNQSLTIQGISLTGGGFVLATGAGDCVANLVLTPSTSCNVIVSLTPTHAGVASGVVTVTSNSLGVTTTQSITVTGNVPGAYLVASASSVDFGSLPTGSSSSAQPVTLTNNGLSYNARISSIASSDPAFVVGTGNCESADVALGSNCVMTLAFSPTTVTNYNATITVTYSSVGSMLPSSTTVFAATGVGTAPQFAVTVMEAGTGTGTVSSSPAGISCPSTCSANYNSGSLVTLTATAGSGSIFAGWSGACSGTGGCSVTMSQARAVTATFSKSDFALSAPTSKTVGQGDFATYLVTETPSNGFSGAVTLSVTGLPTGTTAGFTADPFTGSSAMYIITHSTTALGTYPLTITGTSGALTHSIGVSLAITAHGPVDFALSASPATQTVTHGNSATYTVTETPAGGFSGSVTLVAVNVPAGATATFATNPFTGSTTMTIATTASTPVGTYQIAIGAYSGSILHTTPVTLKVQ